MTKLEQSSGSTPTNLNAGQGAIARLGNRLVGLIRFVFGPIVSIASRIYNFFFGPKDRANPKEEDDQNLTEDQRIKKAFDKEMLKLKNKEDTHITQEMIQAGLGLKFKFQKLNNFVSLSWGRSDGAVNYTFKEEANGDIKISRDTTNAVTQKTITKQEMDEGKGFNLNISGMQLTNTTEIIITQKNQTTHYVVKKNPGPEGGVIITAKKS